MLSTSTASALALVFPDSNDYILIGEILVLLPRFAETFRFMDHAFVRIVITSWRAHNRSFCFGQPDFSNFIPSHHTWGFVTTEAVLAIRILLSHLRYPLEKN